MDEKDYVRKEAWEQTLLRIESMMQASEARMTREIDRAIAQTRAEVNALASKVDANLAQTKLDIVAMTGTIDNVKDHIDNMERRFDRFIAITAGLAGVMTLAITIAQIYIAFWK